VEHALSVVDLSASDGGAPFPSRGQRRTVRTPYALVDGERYAAHVIDLIHDACRQILVAGDIYHRRPYVDGVVLVATPLVVRTPNLIEGVSPEDRDLLGEVLDRLHGTRRIKRRPGPHQIWGTTRREGLYIAPMGQRVPLTIQWVFGDATALEAAAATETLRRRPG
jgi:hypothetical protein